MLLKSLPNQTLGLSRTGVICDRCKEAKVKGRVYKMLVRAGMFYGLQMVEVTRTDRIRNELIRGTAEVEQFGDKV